jgi:hypothetical protein
MINKKGDKRVYLSQASRRSEKNMGGSIDQHIERRRGDTLMKPTHLSL